MKHINQVTRVNKQNTSLPQFQFQFYFSDDELSKLESLDYFIKYGFYMVGVAFICCTFVAKIKCQFTLYFNNVVI